MAVGSRFYLVLNAIADTLNNDPDIGSRNFMVRKKPYNRGAKWAPGAFVSPAPSGTQSPYHEVQSDELIFRCTVVIVNPSDADLTDGMESHMAHIERVEEIFRNKSNSFLPATMQALNTQFATDFAAGKYAQCSISATDVVPDKTFVDPAFEAGYDASGCLVTVRIRVQRLDSTDL